MEIINLVQGSEEWFEHKHGKIGGTSAENLMCADFKTLKNKLLSCHLEPFEMEEGFTSLAMQRGNELEPLARQYISDYTGLEFLEYGWLQSENELFGNSPDGITECQRFSCEIKCPSKEVHTSYITGNVLPYFWQNVSYFAINPKLEKHYFISYRPESKIPAYIVELTRGSEVYRTKTLKENIGESADRLKDKADTMLIELNELKTELEREYMI
tara:strand:+ start:536 stop:1177 length:642 start_codon:yes stop_codon:yes gene_type:complete